MSACPVVLQVFFTKNRKAVPDWPFESEPRDTCTLFGIPLWRPRNKPVCRWAVDYVAAGEERWVIYGPFPSRVAALRALRRIRPAALDGYRILNAHCVEHTPGLKGLPCAVWTDG